MAQVNINNYDSNPYCFWNIYMAGLALLGNSGNTSRHKTSTFDGGTDCIGQEEENHWLAKSCSICAYIYTVADSDLKEISIPCRLNKRRCMTRVIAPYIT